MDYVSRVTSQAPQRYHNTSDCLLHGMDTRKVKKLLEMSEKVFRFSTTFIDQIKETCTI